MNALNLFLIFNLITLLFSLLLSISGRNIFKDESKKYIIPYLNLFKFLEIVRINNLLGIIYFIPVFNIALLIFALYRLSVMYNLDYINQIGLIFIPFVFLPILNNKLEKEETKEKKEEEKKTDELSELGDIMLLNDEQIKALNNSKTDEVKVDNVFKSELKTKENVPAFKANTLKYKEILLEDEKIEKIEKVKPVKVESIRDNRFISKAEINNNEDDDKIEILELWFNIIKKEIKWKLEL